MDVHPCRSRMYVTAMCAGWPPESTKWLTGVVDPRAGGYGGSKAAESVGDRL